MSVADCPVDYPSLDAAVPCALAIAQILKSGDPVSQRAHLVKHAWVVAGAGAGVAFGDPDVPPVVGEAPAPCNVTDDNLPIVAEFFESVKPSDNPKEVKAIPWALLAKYALALLQKFLV